MPTPNEVRQALADEVLRVRPTVIDDRGDPYFPNDDRINFDNEPDRPPASPWARMVVRHHGREQVTMGTAPNRLFETSASLIIQIFTDTGIGVGDADDIAYAFATAFDSKSLPTDGSRLMLGAASTREAPQERDSKLHMAIVEVPFTYEERG